MEKLSKVWFGQFIKEIYTITQNIPEKNFFDLKKDIQKLSILLSRNLVYSDNEYIKKLPIYLEQLDFFINLTNDFAYISENQYHSINHKIKTIRNQINLNIKEKKKN